MTEKKSNNNMQINIQCKNRVLFSFRLVFILSFTIQSGIRIY